MSSGGVWRKKAKGSCLNQSCACICFRAVTPIKMHKAENKVLDPQDWISFSGKSVTNPRGMVAGGRWLLHNAAASQLGSPPTVGWARLWGAPQWAHFLLLPSNCGNIAVSHADPSHPPLAAQALHLWLKWLWQRCWMKSDQTGNRVRGGLNSPGDEIQNFFSRRTLYWGRSGHQELHIFTDGGELEREKWEDKNCIILAFIPIKSEDLNSSKPFKANISSLGAVRLKPPLPLAFLLHQCQK